MDLDALWEHIFSEDAETVRAACDGLAGDERRSVRDFLARVQLDAERVPAQRIAARFALGVIDAPPEGALDFAREQARAHGARLLELGGSFTTSTKSDGTLVTSLDIETDRALRAAILARYPGHEVLSEEGERSFAGREWCWVVDPIDGTTNFSRGFPVWGVLIGLLHFGDPVMGVATFPALGDQLYAARGQGAWRNGARIHTAAETALRANQLFAMCSRTNKRGAPRWPAKTRLAGSTGFDLCMVAAGACVGALDTAVHVWDIAATWPIITEAGGCAQALPDGAIFPLQPGKDYSEVRYTVMVACRPEMMTDCQNWLDSSVMS
jgi:myo-inositol-1(or 4)-monophosphatase